ncbi:MAG: BACON domain-containing protein [Agriterribacter sp.]
MTTQGLVKSFLLIIVISIISCKKDSHKRFVPEIKSNKSEVTFLAEGGRDSILITSTERWKIKKTVNSEWFQFSRDSGEAGITTVYINAQPNVSSAGRVSEIVINSLEEVLTPVSVEIKLDISHQSLPLISQQSLPHLKR